MGTNIQRIKQHLYPAYQFVSVHTQSLLVSSLFIHLMVMLIKWYVQAWDEYVGSSNLAV